VEQAATHREVLDAELGFKVPFAQREQRPAIDLVLQEHLFESAVVQCIEEVCNLHWCPTFWRSSGRFGGWLGRLGNSWGLAAMERTSTDA
jgi:hypothetical protein